MGVVKPTGRSKVATPTIIGWVSVSPPKLTVAPCMGGITASRVPTSVLGVSESRSLGVSESTIPYSVIVSAVRVGVRVTVTVGISGLWYVFALGVGKMAASSHRLIGVWG